MTSIDWDQCCVVDNNSRKQDKEKNTIQANSVKREYHIIKGGISYGNILSAVSNILSVTNTTEDSTESTLQAIIPLYYDTIKDAFIHMGGNISDFTDLKN